MLSREDRECEVDMVDTRLNCFIDEDSCQSRLLGELSSIKLTCFHRRFENFGDRQECTP